VPGHPHDRHGRLIEPDVYPISGRRVRGHGLEESGVILVGHGIAADRKGGDINPMGRRFVGIPVRAPNQAGPTGNVHQVGSSPGLGGTT
jgi:hypothetical protein